MMQHQFWVTKKTVLKKWTKEDECIVSSDAELDAKLELFRSISDSCLHLQRILDQYQERLCILAQEENSLGRFLRDTGKSAEASGSHMVSAGKAICFSGQQRLAIRNPLLRLYHEVETFRGRAVSDMRSTVSAMEKARTEYRAALSWMKSTSTQLDPDTGRGLDNFRKAQRQVRESKKLFDKLTLDVLQKIDLLAAARCNMFSHVLSNYQSSFLTFSNKVAQTLTASADTMKSTPQYEFSVLKELSQSLEDSVEEKKKEFEPQDRDEMLFFQSEYKDEENAKETENKTKNMDSKHDSENNEAIETEQLIPLTIDLIDGLDKSLGVNTSGISDLVGLQMDNDSAAVNSRMFVPSQLLQNLKPVNLLDNPAPSTSQNTSSPQTNKMKPAPKKDDKAAWFKLFAELDPLANPDTLLGNNQSHAA